MTSTTYKGFIVGPLVICAVLAGCASGGWENFALSSPARPGDVRKLHAALSAAGVRSAEGVSSLASVRLLVQSREFRRGKDLAEKVVVRDALTLRICARQGAETYEVWQDGKKVGEETVQPVKTR